MPKLAPPSLATALVAALLVLAPAPGAHAATYSAPLATAISDLPVAAEVRDGYSRSLFPHWVDADRDGCNTRYEVLDTESENAITCSDVSGGRWFSYYDRVSWTDPGRIDIDHMVPLAEAWDSGAHGWTTEVRREYANDLGAFYSLVGVTDTVNQSKGAQDPSTWMPTYDKCRYLRDWVSVKHRWRLTVDATERSRMLALHDEHGCASRTVSVTYAR